MDDALVQSSFKNYFKFPRIVLILVVMDDALVLMIPLDMELRRCVLILVVMDDALVQNRNYKVIGT